MDGESGSDNAAKEEESSTPDKEPEEDVDYELIESVVHKGKMIKRQLSVQSHSKSVADLFSGMSVADDSNLSITGSRKVYGYAFPCNNLFRFICFVIIIVL